MFKRKNQGFTLMEMLIVLAIFSIVVVAISDIFVRASRAERRTSLQVKLQSDIRNAVEVIAQEAKVGTIDYAAYGGILPVMPVEVLYLLDPDNLQVQFRKQNDPLFCPDVQSTPCLEMSIDGGLTYSPLTSRGTIVEDLKFYIVPSQDPFALQANGTYLADQMPRVTLVIRAVPVTPRLEERMPITLQTTIATRVYRR